MKTTFDLPDDLLERVKISAAKRRTTLKNLVLEGLELVLKKEPAAEGALERLRSGFHLGGQPLKREDTHGR